MAKNEEKEIFEEKIEEKVEKPTGKTKVTFGTKGEAAIKVENIIGTPVDGNITQRDFNAILAYNAKNGKEGQEYIEI